MYVYRLAAAPKSPLWAVGRATVCAKLANGGAFDIYGLPHCATHVIASERATRIMVANAAMVARTDRLWRVGGLTGWRKCGVKIWRISG